MNSKTLIFGVLLSVFYVFIESRGQLLPIPVDANEEERELCENSVEPGENKTLTSAQRDHRLGCKVTCVYDDQSNKTVNSPDGQPCCSIIGILPTGTCREGECETVSII